MTPVTCALVRMMYVRPSAKVRMVSIFLVIVVSQTFRFVAMTPQNGSLTAKPAYGERHPPAFESDRHGKF